VPSAKARLREEKERKSVSQAERGERACLFLGVFFARPRPSGNSV